MNYRQCSECDKESSGSEVENVDTSAPRKLRHCKDDVTASEEIQLPSTPSTPTSSKNIVSNVVTPEPHPMPKLTIKPIITQPPVIEPVQVDNSSYNHPTSVNPVPITPREGSPQYMVASTDGTESVSQRSAKKRRREKHKRYTPDPITGVKQRKRKHKRKSLDVENPETHPEFHRRITIKVFYNYFIILAKFKV